MMLYIHNAPGTEYNVSCCWLRPQDDSGCCTAEVVGVEMVPSSLLDKEAAVQQLQQLLQEGAAASDSWTKAKTLLGCGVAMSWQQGLRVRLAHMGLLRRCVIPVFRQELLGAVIRAAP